jgi:hypothetical protein
MARELAFSAIKNVKTRKQHKKLKDGLLANDLVVYSIFICIIELCLYYFVPPCIENCIYEKRITKYLIVSILVQPPQR